MLDFGFCNEDCMIGMKSMEDSSVDLTLTDIPFGEVNNTRDGGGIRQIKKGIADIITFNLEEFLEQLYRVTKGTIIVFCGRSQVSRISDYFTERKMTVRQIIWQKTNPSPVNGQFTYLSGIENAIYARKAKATFNAFCKNTVFLYPTGESVIHPTEKNHRLLADLINDNSNIGQIVFDPCAGSGSTLLIAKRNGRKYIGFEKNKQYYVRAKERLNAETSQVTVFDFIKQEEQTEQLSLFDLKGGES